MSPFYNQEDTTWTYFNTPTTASHFWIDSSTNQSPYYVETPKRSLNPKEYAQLHLAIAKAGPRVTGSTEFVPKSVSASTSNLRVKRSARSIRTGFNRNVKRV